MTRQMPARGAHAVPATGVYFNEVLMFEKPVLSVEPRPLTAAMMASEMPAAISPYSMAVAADSSARKPMSKRRKNYLLVSADQDPPGRSARSFTDKLLN